MIYWYWKRQLIRVIYAVNYNWFKKFIFEFRMHQKDFLFSPRLVRPSGADIMESTTTIKIIESKERQTIPQNLCSIQAVNYIIMTKFKHNCSNSFRERFICNTYKLAYILRDDLAHTTTSFYLAVNIRLASIEGYGIQRKKLLHKKTWDLREMLQFGIKSVKIPKSN